MATKKTKQREQMTVAEERCYRAYTALVNSGRPAPSLEEIAERMDGGYSPASASRLMQKLEEKGYIGREAGKYRSFFLVAPVLQFGPINAA